MSDDIEEVRKAEERRGRRPIDTDTRDERKRGLAALRDIITYGSTEDLEDFTREFGISRDSPEWNAILKLWNDARGRS